MFYTDLADALQDASDAVRHCNIQRIRNRAPSMADQEALAKAVAKAACAVSTRKVRK